MRAQSATPVTAGEREYFSPVLGGPLFRLLCRARLSTEDLQWLKRRVVVVTLLAWVPLLLLAVLEGNAFGERVRVPFFQDFAVHLRFLVALPLLFVAEYLAHQSIRAVMMDLEERRLVPPDANAQFEAALHSAFRARNSVLAEGLILVLVFAIGFIAVQGQYVRIDTTTWFSTPAPAGQTLSWAGLWYGCVSLPVFQFLLLRWYFRVLVWARFMWQLSRIRLNLVPTHPDRAGGLGFIANSVNAFVVLALAHSVMLSGQLLNRIVHLDAHLTDFVAEISALVVLMLVLALGPLTVFAGQLGRLRRRGLDEYGLLAHRLACDFDAKWVRGGAPSGEPFLGSPDISALADMSGNYEVIENMRPIPIAPELLLPLLLAVVLPLLPLTLTMVPLEAALQFLIGLLF